MFHINYRNRRTFDCTPSLGQAATRIHLSSSREAGPLTHNIMFHENSFLLQGSKIFKFNFYFLELPIFYVVLYVSSNNWEFGLTWRTFLNTVMSVRILQKRKSWPTE
jgi:hypothetical protein